VDGKTVLVHGVLGGVGALAAQLAAWRGANVIGTVRRCQDVDQVDTTTISDVVALDGTEISQAIRASAPGGVDRIIEVAFSENVDLDSAVARHGTVIAAYGTRRARPDFPFWPMLFNNVTIRLLASDDFSAESKRLAVVDLTTAAEEGVLGIQVGDPLPLEYAAEAHERVAVGSRRRVLLTPSR
jgi:NADPH2:quinone reductase